jgi:hypothetical protein
MGTPQVPDFWVTEPLAAAKLKDFTRLFGKTPLHLAAYNDT